MSYRNDTALSVRTSVGAGILTVRSKGRLTYTCGPVAQAVSRAQGTLNSNKTKITADFAPERKGDGEVSELFPHQVIPNV